MDLDAAFRAFSANELPGSVLRRMLILHAGWLAPMDGVSPRVITDKSGKRHAFAFTNAAAAAVAQRELGAKIDLGHLSPPIAGHTLFDVLGRGFDVVNLATETGRIHYDAEQIRKFGSWLAEVRVEGALAEVLTVSGPAHERCVREIAYPSYRVVMQRSTVVLAPDARGRKLLAVFSAADTLEAFLQRLDAHETMEQHLVVTQTGAELFALIERTPGLDGIVLNCMGPVRPAAFQPAFAQVALASLASG